MSVGRNNRRVNLSLQQRLDILRKLEDGVSLTRLANDYGVSSITIRRIQWNHAQLRQLSETPGSEGRKKMRRPVLDELDVRLHAWFLEQQVTGERISDASLQEKAIQLNREFGGPSSFSAPKGWIWRFKKRHGIHGARYENAELPARSAEEFTRAFLRRLEEGGIKPQNVYNMDETGLMWKALPRVILNRAGERRICGNKIKMARVSVGLCANATGTHKLPPLFVHRYERPRALKHCRDRLPVVFKAQRNAWVNRNVFADWLENDFVPAVRNQQLERGTCEKVLLLVDDYTAHVLPPELQMEDDGIEVVLLPANLMPILQPMCQGVTKKLKRSFRHRMLRRITEFPGGVVDFYADYDVKDCIDLVNEAWLDVTQVNIRDSWRKLLGIRATNEEEATERQRSMIAIRETVGTIVREMVHQDEVHDWFSACEQDEVDPDELEVEDEECPDHGEYLDEEEVERLMMNLVLWAEDKPDFIKFHARLLKDYYDLEKKSR